MARKHHPGTSEILRSLANNWPIVLIGTLMVTMTTVSFYMITAYTPTFGSSVLHLSSADSLIVVEVITPGGHWSSYPPHKHDCDQGGETRLEETYYHRLARPGGFAFQRVYTDDRTLDETMTVQDRDVVLVPRGYHPVSAAHGFDLYYLNVMAGPVRRWQFTNAPGYEFLTRG